MGALDIIATGAAVVDPSLRPVASPPRER